MTKPEMQQRWDDLQEIIMQKIWDNSELIAVRENQVVAKTDVEKALNEAFIHYMKNENLMLYNWLDRKHKEILKTKEHRILHISP